MVVLVHGRGHLGDDTAALRSAWKRELDWNLERAGLAALPDSVVRLAWYADVMDPTRNAACTRAVQRSSRNDSLGFGDFARDFIGALASSLPQEESREARTLLGDMLYAVDPSRRCAAEARVGALLDSAASQGRPVILIGYSLGAMVSYDALARRGAARRPPVHFITIGSPLGNPEIRALLGLGNDPLVVPAGVASWENIYNPDDAFAAPLQNSVKDVRDVALDERSSGDPHYIHHYLRDRATGAALGRALCRTGAFTSPTCNALAK